jgi:serine/threonine-protein kinase
MANSSEHLFTGPPPSHRRPSSLIGRTIAGRFDVRALLGEGGMAIVYRATQQCEPRDVAIKVLNAQLASETSFVKRFRREARAASLLRHPSTVRILDCGVDEGVPYIAMELCEGVELARILQHERRLPESRAARILSQVCGALSAAHDLGIVHRDLKPENVMVSRDSADPALECVKVLDFGIAKVLEPEGEFEHGSGDDGDEEAPSSRSKLTMAGTVVGTPEYMSPEQSRGGAVDARSDIYACGVLLYQMVTGRVPFSGQTCFETALMHVRDEPIPPSTLVPLLHPELEALILKALSKSAADRPQTASELQEALIEMVPELSRERLASIPPPYARRSLLPPVPAAGDRATVHMEPSVVLEPRPRTGALEQAPDSDDTRTRVLPATPEGGPTPPSSSVPLALAETVGGPAYAPISTHSESEPPTTVLLRPARAPARSRVRPLVGVVVGLGLGALAIVIVAAILTFIVH